MSEFWSDFRFWLETLMTIALFIGIIAMIALIGAAAPWTLLVSVPAGTVAVAALLALSGALARRS